VTSYKILQLTECLNQLKFLTYLSIQLAFYKSVTFLWPPYVIGQAIIFLPCGFYLLSSFSSPNLSGHRLDVYHTSTHGVTLVRI